MSSTETVNDEFEVGFNQDFEHSWYKAEIVGRVVMILFVIAAFLGLLGRGPFSHRSAYSPSGALSVDYEPIARHGTSTMITVHLKQARQADGPVHLLLDQHMIEPMGFQHATPMADHTSVSDAGAWLTFDQKAGQHDAMVRFDVSPTAVGPVPMSISDGADTVSWSMLVLP